MGYWVDLENPYITFDNSYIETCWHLLKELHNKDMLYKGYTIQPYSPAAGTGLSSHELNQPGTYKMVKDTTVVAQFKAVRNEKSEVLFTSTDAPVYFLAWTTTPWTLPSNLALCMGPEIEYVKIHDKDKDLKFIIAKDRVESYSKKRNYEVLETFKGSDLKGLKYEPMFKYFNNRESEDAFVVLNDGYVTTTDGTGIVHIAPAFGEDDNRIMKEAGLHFIECPVDDAGKFTSEVTDFAGVHVKTADKDIIKKLKDEGILYDQGVLVHSYPFCPRSDTPLIYRSIPSWYVSVEKIKEQLFNDIISSGKKKFINSSNCN
jgi:isoleucyl-tRNA synthetase